MSLARCSSMMRRRSRTERSSTDTLGFLDAGPRRPWILQRHGRRYGWCRGHAVALSVAAEGHLVDSPPQGDLAGDPALLDQLPEMLVQALHPVLSPGLDRGGDLMDLRLPDQISHCRRGDEHLHGWHAAPEIGVGEEELG